MATPNPNNDILAAAEYAIKVAKQELGRNLDYSEDSLEDFDILVEHVKRHFSKINADGKLSGKALQRASISLGGYLGEVIRKRQGGAWTIKTNGVGTLIIDGQEFSPILYIYRRLTNPQELPLHMYLSDVEQKISTKTATADNKFDLGQQEVVATHLENPNNKNRSIFIWIAGIFVFVCISLLVSIAIYSNIRATNDFKSKLNNFLVDADQLNLMTEQGVSYQEFRTQLIEVKSTYVSLDSWPSAYQDEKQAFDKAIEGWDLTLEVWKVYLDDQYGFLNTKNEALLKDVATYLGMDSTKVDALTAGLIVADDWIGELMGQASTYLEAGKAGVK